MHTIALSYSKCSAVESLLKTALAVEEYIRTENWLMREDELEQVKKYLDYFYDQIALVFQSSTSR